MYGQKECLPTNFFLFGSFTSSYLLILGVVMTFIPQQLYGGKWSWKTIDEEVRRFFRLDSGAQQNKSGFVFQDDRVYIRKYEGHPDFYEIEAAKKPVNFTFFPTGTKAM
jgi:hypothetical protein